MSAKKQDVAHIEQFPIEQHNTNFDSLAAAASTPECISPVKQAPEGDTALALFQGTEQLYEAIDPGEERKLVKKIDMVILPCLAVCYVFYYIDKTTLSYAAIFGIKDDLHLEGTKYSWLSSIFYFGWLAWSFPTNYLMQKFPVAKYLAFNIFMWGVLLMCQAAARNFTELAILRALSGAAEGCSDSSFMIITSMWYTRREQPIRIGLWYSANGVGIAVGGLIGYGIGNIRGSLSSWKYEFLIVGACCCIWGIVLFFFLPDSPVTAKILSTGEKRMAVERLRGNQTGVENKMFKWRQVREWLGDYKTYMFFLIGMVANIPNGGISNFGTLIIKGFGFSTLVTTLMQIPYGVIIAISILACVFLNDRLPPNNRCFMIILFMLPNITGAFGLLFLPSTSQIPRLIMYYLTGPYNASFVLLISVVTANVAGHTKKVLTNATLFVGACVGNISGPFFYKTAQAPRYGLGIGSMVVAHVAEVLLILGLRWGLKRENERRERDGVGGGDRVGDGGFGREEGEERRRKDLDRTAFADLTDRENLNFRYIY
ncbi:MFS allantoate transporter protein [Rutstroemia sp. NJR-2017a BBW]|nr:MFS allantoate transporter protein [Rutstroemia sp. NJR-2017a BBW]